jgi:FOG: TPR repeat, SEL1 subfamily
MVMLNFILRVSTITDVELKRTSAKLQSGIARPTEVKGNADAQFNLGTMYGSGQGVPKDYTEAAKLYRAAAEQGYAEGQNGVSYQYGLGVPKDYVLAYMWFNLAGAGSDDLGNQNRDRLEKLMTPDQVAEAQKRTSEWQPKTSSVATESRSAAAAAPPSNETVADLFGTGFFVTRDGEALTNAHVVDGCSQTSARFGNQDFAARVLNRDVQNDLALIKVEVRPDDVAHFRLTAKQGENVAVYGFPLPGLLSSGGNLTGGNVTALTGLSDDSRFLQISAPVQPGNSGGPLF